MKPLYVFGDVHLGTERSSGTTPFTRQKLKEDLLANYADLLCNAKGYLLINGDWLDTDKIALKDLFECYRLTSEWLTINEKLYISEGNHCQAGNAQNTSSFDLLCKLLVAVHGDKVVPIYGSLYLPAHDAYVISSLRNQDLFDQALTQVPKCSTVYLHCNYDNFFAASSQHSLNLTEEQAAKLPAQRIVMSHEHGHRKALNGKVHLIGAPFCSSVSDCVASDEKYMVKVAGDTVEYIATWEASTDFSRQDWRNLQDTGARFIRVEGDATASEAADAVSAISKFRARSEALVITNAVRVEGATPEEIELSVEQMAVFDVKAAVLELFTAEERSVLVGLLEA
jgi:hypothetical protein